MTAGTPDGDSADLTSLAEDLDAFFKAEPEQPRPDAGRPPQLPGSDYRLVSLLGSGGMGTVWEAEQISLNRRVAVKVLAVPSAERPAWRARFVHESQIVAQLHHPGIVKVFAAGSCGETCWYAMELVEGVSLNRCAFPGLRAAVEGIRMAAEALAYAHRCGVVHRDVKPANLLVDAQGRVLVADFGLAVSTGDDPDTGARDGTRRYMAPERLRDGVCGPAADQYALALVLREQLARFDLGSYGPDLLAVLDKAQAADPAARYADMDVFSHDLRCVLAYEPSVARRTSFFHRAVLWCRRHPRAAVATGVAMFCACGFVAALCVGYARTAAARRQADRNARVADEALTRVFDHVATGSPSLDDATLLSALSPYYEQLAGGTGGAADKTETALAAEGICAFRSNDYALAERAFRQLVARRRRPSDLNWLAETLRRQGRKEESESVARQIVAEFSASASDDDRHEVACALEVLGERRHRGNPDHAAAFAIFHSLLRAHPDRAYYRFRTLRLLATDLGLGAGTDLPTSLREVAVEMGRLADAHPDEVDYGNAAVELMSRLLKRGELDPASDLPLLQQTCRRGDALLGRFFSSECVILAVTEFRAHYAAWLQQNGRPDEARLQRVRTETMTELLAGAAGLPMPQRGQHAVAGGVLPFRWLDCPGKKSDAPATLVVMFHARGLCGVDNTQPLSMPQLRALVLFGRRREGRTVILVPQCPEGRAETWFGASRGQPDALFDGLADLVAQTASQLGIPPARVCLVGDLEGADAALALAARRPGLAGRVLAAGPKAVPEDEASRIVATVQVCQAEFDRTTRPDAMARSLEAFGAAARTRPVLSVLQGQYRTTVGRAASADVYLEWLFRPEPAVR